jgi:amino acid adenylation domain-containing protein
VTLDREAGRSLRSAFLEVAAAHPGALALAVGDREIAYGELAARARAWAGHLVEQLGRPAARIGVLGHRSEIAYTGVLAALCTGAAFVPLNPTFPIDRTRAMLEAADVDALIVDAGATGQLGAVLAGGLGPRLVALPANDAAIDAAIADRVVLGARALDAASRTAPLPPVTPDDVAYLLFTSGSTGRPKGVPVTHGNVLAFLDHVAARYQIDARDRFSQTFEQTFDLSVFDLFLPWSRGASVHAFRPIDLLAPARVVARQELTVWFSVPSIPALMTKKGFLRPGIMPTLRWSLFCGEPLPEPIALAWQAAAPGSIVENLYGPTELTIACLQHRWSPDTSPALCHNGLVPIGRPYPGLTAAVVGDDGQAAAPGEAGELWVSGPQTVPGYWRDPATTAARFVSGAALGAPERRFYRTGDRVRRLASGDYVYLGRVDNQVKVLGYRVELGDVEAALRACPGVVDAIAVPWPVEPSGAAQGLVGFVAGRDLDAAAVIAAVRQTLPDYMVPRDLHVLAELPLNANGKLDRRALADRLTTPATPVGSTTI